MGSAKISNAAVITMSETDKKSLKKRIIAFFNKDKKKEKPKNEKDNKEKGASINKDENPVDKIVKNFEKFNIENKVKKELEDKDDNEDESEFFSYKIVEDDSRSQRIDSQSSEDSGFADVKVEDDVVASMSNLKIDSNKKKKSKIVVVPRGPDKRKVKYTACPYTVRQDDGSFRQISQINKHTLTGGQVIVNSGQGPDNYSEVDIALQSVEKISQTSQKEQEYWEDVLQLIHDDTTKKTLQQSIQESLETSNDFLADFVQIHDDPLNTIQMAPTETPEPNPIEEFSTATHSNYEKYMDLTNILNLDQIDEAISPKTSVFLTPPRSENVPSPMSESQASFYPSNSDYTLSPERSSPIDNCDYEKFQDLTHFDEFPLSHETIDKRERTSSISSMTMKQFKDLQKEIANNFSKKECCEVNRKSCKEILQEHLSKLKKVDRKNLCLRVAKLDLKTSYGVLHHIIIALSRGAEQLDLQYSLFGLICERVLAQKPALFAYDFGLSLLKSAALRCPQTPMLTRYLVQCIRTALKTDATIASSKENVFNEVDAQGDNLLIACARAGDAYAQVLSEIVRNEFPDQPPLFRIHHTNADGYTALHVCCSQHSSASPRLQVAHVLLEHAGADLWKGDLKGGDTALHLAVNSANCDIKLIMILFKQVDRKQWKSLAHCRNLSSVTPLEYARSATKSTTRQNYPHEVLEFLKKCR